MRIFIVALFIQKQGNLHTSSREIRHVFEIAKNA